MNREKGFYWIKTDDGWTIAEFDGKSWWFIGGDEPLFTKEDIFEVGERIINPYENH